MHLGIFFLKRWESVCGFNVFCLIVCIKVLWSEMTYLFDIIKTYQQPLVGPAWNSPCLKLDFMVRNENGLLIETVRGKNAPFKINWDTWWKRRSVFSILHKNNFRAWQDGHTNSASKDSCHHSSPSPNPSPPLASAPALAQLWLWLLCSPQPSSRLTTAATWSSHAKSFWPPLWRVTVQ